MELAELSSSLDIDTFAENLVEEGAIAKFAHANCSKLMNIGAVYTDNHRGIPPDELAKVSELIMILHAPRSRLPLNE